MSKSKEISYGFGQMGSVYQNLADKPIYPPKDHIIVAIQFIAGNTLSALHTETLDQMGPQYVTTEDDELATAGGPDSNYLGVVEAAATSATAAGLITLTNDTAATNARIQPGQVIIIGADGDTVDAGMTIDDLTGGANIAQWTPIYEGTNQQWLEVESITGQGTGAGNVKVQVRAHGAGMQTLMPNLANIDASNTIYFLDTYHGAGGTTLEGTLFPTGIVIYGRWTMAQLGSTDADGGIICYFGK